MRIYVGNLNYRSTDEGMSELFGQHGAVASATILTDRETGRSRGFGFIEMENDDEARAAIVALNGHDLDGRDLRVNEARPREPRSRW